MKSTKKLLLVVLTLAMLMGVASCLTLGASAADPTYTWARQSITFAGGTDGYTWTNNNAGVWTAENLGKSSTVATKTITVNKSAAEFTIEIDFKVATESEDPMSITVVRNGEAETLYDAEGKSTESITGTVNASNPRQYDPYSSSAKVEVKEGETVVITITLTKSGAVDNVAGDTAEFGVKVLQNGDTHALNTESSGYTYMELSGQTGEKLDLTDERLFMGDNLRRTDSNNKVSDIQLGALVRYYDNSGNTIIHAENVNDRTTWANTAAAAAEGLLGADGYKVAATGDFTVAETDMAAGYEVAGWATVKDGTQAYAQDEAAIMTADTNLYPVAGLSPISISDYVNQNYNASYTGENVALSFTATHNANVTWDYQWFKVGAGSEGSNLSVGNDSTLNVKTVADSGTYYCVVTATDSNGLTTSTTTDNFTVNITKATLTITPTHADIQYGSSLGTIGFSADGLKGDDVADGLSGLISDFDELRSAVHTGYDPYNEEARDAKAYDLTWNGSQDVPLGNYAVDFAAGSFEVTPFVLQLAITSITAKTYDGTTDATGVTLGVSNDFLPYFESVDSVTCSSAVWTSPNANTNTVSVSGLDFTVSDDAIKTNYKIETTDGTVTLTVPSESAIKQRRIVVGTLATSVVYGEDLVPLYAALAADGVKPELVEGHRIVLTDSKYLYSSYTKWVTNVTDPDITYGFDLNANLGDIISCIKILSAENDDVDFTSNYQIGVNKTNRALTVIPRPVKLVPKFGDLEAGSDGNFTATYGDNNEISWTYAPGSLSMYDNHATSATVTFDYTISDGTGILPANTNKLNVLSTMGSTYTVNQVNVSFTGVNVGTGNYDFTFQEVKLTINPRVIYLTLDDDYLNIEYGSAFDISVLNLLSKVKVTGDTQLAVGDTLDGYLEAINFAYDGSEYQAGAPAGSTFKVYIEAISKRDRDNYNYIFNGDPTGATLTVVPKKMVVDWVNADAPSITKAYDGTTGVSDDFALNKIIKFTGATYNNETVEFRCDSAYYNDANAGTDKVVTYANVTLSSTNYVIDYDASVGIFQEVVGGYNIDVTSAAITKKVLEDPKWNLAKIEEDKLGYVSNGVLYITYTGQSYGTADRAKIKLIDYVTFDTANGKVTIDTAAHTHTNANECHMYNQDTGSNCRLYCGIDKTEDFANYTFNLETSPEKPTGDRKPGQEFRLAWNIVAKELTAPNLGDLDVQFTYDGNSKSISADTIKNLLSGVVAGESITVEAFAPTGPMIWHGYTNTLSATDAGMYVTGYKLGGKTVSAAIPEDANGNTTKNYTAFNYKFPNVNSIDHAEIDADGNLYIFWEIKKATFELELNPLYVGEGKTPITIQMVYGNTTRIWDSATGRNSNVTLTSGGTDLDSILALVRQKGAANGGNTADWGIWTADFDSKNVKVINNNGATEIIFNVTSLTGTTASNYALPEGGAILTFDVDDLPAGSSLGITPLPLTFSLKDSAITIANITKIYDGTTTVNNDAGATNLLQNIKINEGIAAAQLEPVNRIWGGFVAVYVDETGKATAGVDAVAIAVTMKLTYFSIDTDQGYDANNFTIRDEDKLVKITASNITAGTQFINPLGITVGIVENHGLTMPCYGEDNNLTSIGYTYFQITSEAFVDHLGVTPAFTAGSASSDYTPGADADTDIKLKSFADVEIKAGDDDVTDNYTITPSTEVIGQVQKRQLTITLNTAVLSMTYGETLPSIYMDTNIAGNVASMANVIVDNTYNNENAEFSSLKFTLTGYNGNAGTYDIEAVATLTNGATGNDFKADNYTVKTPIESKFTVNRAAISIESGDIAVLDKYYDGTSKAEINVNETIENLREYFPDLGEQTLSIEYSLSFSSSNAASQVSVSLNSMTIKIGENSGNYYIENAASLQLQAQIKKAPIVIRGITVSEKTYDGTPNATINISGVQIYMIDTTKGITGEGTVGSPYLLTVLTTPGVIGNDDVSVNCTASFPDKNAGANKEVPLTLSLTGNGSSNYEIIYDGNNNGTYYQGAENLDANKLTVKTLTANINPKSVTFSGVTGTNIIYGTKTGDSRNNVEYNLANAVLGGVLTDDIGKVSLALNTANGTPYGTIADVNAGNGIPVTFSINHFTLAGGESANYSIATADNQKSMTVNITKATVIVTASNSTIQYREDGRPNENQPFTVSGIIVEDLQTTESQLDAFNRLVTGTVTFTYPGYSAGDNKGTYKIRPNVSGLRATNYTFIANSKDGDLEVTIAVNEWLNPTWTSTTEEAANVTTAGKDSKVYSSFYIDYTATPKFGNVTILYSFDGDVWTASKESMTDAGTYYIKLTVPGADNYLGLETKITYTIEQKKITITSISASDKVYDAAIGAEVKVLGFTGQLSGHSLTVTANASFRDKNAENNKIVDISGYTITDGGTGLAKNYTIDTDASPFTTTANITVRPITITGIRISSKYYDGTTDVTNSMIDLTGIAYGGNGVVGGDLFGTPVIGGAFQTKNAANGITVVLNTVNLTASAESGHETDYLNYSVTVTAVLTADILPARLVISPTADQSKVYGTADPELTFTYRAATNAGGFTDEDTLFVGETPNFGSTSLSRAQGENAGQYAITIGAIALSDNGDFIASNYAPELDSTTVNFTINRKVIEIVPDSLTKAFGDANPEFTFTVKNSDNLTIDWDALGINGYTGKEIITTQGALDRTGNNTDKSANVVGVYTVDLYGTAAVASDSNSTFSSDFSADNYELKLVDNTNVFTITPRQVTIHAVDAADYTGGNVSFTFTVTDSGENFSYTNVQDVLFGANFASITLTTNGASAGTYNGSNITVAELIINDNDSQLIDSSNFEILFTENTLLTLNKKLLTVNLDKFEGITKIYDGTALTLNITDATTLANAELWTGLCDLDVVTLVNIVTASANAGEYTATSGFSAAQIVINNKNDNSIDVTANYEITISGKLTIDQRLFVIDYTNTHEYTGTRFTAVWDSTDSLGNNSMFTFLSYGVQINSDTMVKTYFGDNAANIPSAWGLVEGHTVTKIQVTEGQILPRPFGWDSCHDFSHADESLLSIVNGGVDVSANYRLIVRGGVCDGVDRNYYITPKTITVVIGADTEFSMVYDGTTTANIEAVMNSLKYSFEGLVDGCPINADLALVIGSATFNDKDVKDANALTLSGLSLSSNNKITQSDLGTYYILSGQTATVSFPTEYGRYEISGSPDNLIIGTNGSGTAAITPKPVTLEVNPSVENTITKVYDGTPWPAANWTDIDPAMARLQFKGVVDGDTLTLRSGNDTFSFRYWNENNMDAGVSADRVVFTYNYKSLTGTDASNYKYDAIPEELQKYGQYAGGNVDADETGYVVVIIVGEGLITPAPLTVTYNTSGFPVISYGDVVPTFDQSKLMLSAGAFPTRDEKGHYQYQSGKLDDSSIDENMFKPFAIAGADITTTYTQGTDAGTICTIGLSNVRITAGTGEKVVDVTENFAITVAEEKFEVQQRQLTLELDADDFTKVYDGNSSNPAYFDPNNIGDKLNEIFAVSNVYNNEPVTFSSLLLTRAEGENVGKYAITLSSYVFDDNGTFKAKNYKLGLKDSSEFEITSRPLYVMVDAEQSYTGSVFEYTILPADLIDAETGKSWFVDPQDGSTAWANGTFMIGGKLVTSGATVGMYNTQDTSATKYYSISTALSIKTANGETDLTDNYEISYVKNGESTVELEITKAKLFIKIDDQEITYGDNAPVYTFTIEGLMSGEDISNALLYTADGDLIMQLTDINNPNIVDIVIGSRYSVKSPAGEYPITLVSDPLIIGEGSNYEWTDPVNGTLTVNRKKLALKVEDVEVEYGTDLTGYAHKLVSANDTYSFVQGDTFADLTINAAVNTNGVATFTFTCAYGITSDAGVDYPIISGTNALAIKSDNYEIVRADGTEITGVGDIVDGTLKVTKRTLYVTPESVEKTYGEADPDTFDFEYSNTVGNQIPIIKGTISREPGENVGEYEFVVGGLSLQTNSTNGVIFNANNYTIEVVQVADEDGNEKTLKFTINRRKITISADDIANVTLGALATKVYDGTVTGNTITDSNQIKIPFTVEQVVNGYEGFNDAGKFYVEIDTITYDNKNVGTGKTLTFTYTITDETGNDVAKNYIIDEIASETTLDAGEITPRIIKVTGIDAVNKIYNALTEAEINLADVQFVFSDDSNALVDGDILTIASYKANFSDKNVGNGKTVYITDIVLGGLDSGNYSLAVESIMATAETTANITARPITVSGITADQRAYNGTLGITFNYDKVANVDFCEGDMVQIKAEGALTSPDVVYINGTKTATSQTVQIKIIFEGDDRDNYTLAAGSQGGVDVTITPAALTITLDDKTITYGDNAPEFTYQTPVGFVNNEGVEVLTGLNITSTYDTTDATKRNVGTYPIVMNEVDANNYTITVVPATLEVGRKALTVTAYAETDGTTGYDAATDNKITYGDAIPTYTAVYGEFAWGEDESVLLNTLLITCSYQQFVSGYGTYDIIPSNLTASNYEIEFVTTKLVVGRATLTITANDSALTFGDEPAANGITYEGLLGTDSQTTAVTFTGGALYSFLDAEGNPIAKFAPAYNADGQIEYRIVINDVFASANYDIVRAEGTLVFAKRNLDVSVQANGENELSITYGDATPVYSIDVNTALLAGEDDLIEAVKASAGLTFSGIYEKGNAVGTYTVTATLDDYNYTITVTDGTVTVGRATLSVYPFIDFNGNGIYDADEDNKLTFGDIPVFSARYEGFVNDDTAALVIGEFSAQTNYVKGDHVSTTPYSMDAALSSLAADNYNIVYPEDGFLVISRILTVRPFVDTNGDGEFSAEADNKIVYGSEIAGLLVTIENWADLDGHDRATLINKMSEDRLTIITNYVVGNPCGTAITAQVTTGFYMISADYTFEYENTEIEIIKRKVTVAANDNSIVYGNEAAANGVVINNVYGNDTLGEMTFTFVDDSSSPYTVGSPVGAYKIVPLLPENANYEFEYIAGTLTVTVRIINVSVADSTIVYGDDAKVADGIFTNTSLILANDLAGFNFTFKFYNSDKSAEYTPGNIPGAYIIELQSDYTANSNYEITIDNAVATLTVTKKDIAIVVDDKEITYADGTDKITPTWTLAAGSVLFTGDADKLAELFTGAVWTYSNFADSATADYKLYEAGDPAGTYVITLSGISSTCYNITEIQSGTLTVNKAKLTITGFYDVNGNGVFDEGVDNMLTYGDAADTAKYVYVITGYLNNDSFADAFDTVTVVVSSAYAQFNNAGKYDINTLVNGELTNYTTEIVNTVLDVAKAKLTITMNLETVYGNAAPAFELTAGMIAGLLGTDTVDLFVLTSAEFACEYDITNSEKRNAGSYPISLTKLDYAAGADENYTFELQGELVVKKATLTITVDAFGTITYGDAAPEFTYTAQGFCYEDTQELLGTIENDLTYGKTEFNAGSYVFKAVVAENDNYDFNCVEATLVVGRKALTVTLNVPAPIVYGSDKPVLNAEFSGFVFTDDVNSLTGTMTLRCDYGVGSPVGTYPIQLILSDDFYYDNNYDIAAITTPDDYALVVNARPVTVTADSFNVTYGDVAPSYTFAVTEGSLVLGHTLADIVTLTTASAYGAMSPVGEYEITLEKVVINVNYDVTVVNGKLTVEAKAIIVTPEDYFKAIGATDPATFRYTYTGNIDSVNPVFEGKLGRVEGETAGAYAYTLGTLVLRDNPPFYAKNYKLVLDDSTSFFIVDLGFSSIIGASLSLEDVVYMNYSFTLVNEANVSFIDRGLLMWTEAEYAELSAYNYDAAHRVSDLRNRVYADFNVYGTSTPIQAKNYGEKLYVRAYVQLEDGTYIYSRVVGASPEDYAKQLIASTVADKHKAVVIALMDYGAAADAHFNETPASELCNAFITDEMRAACGAKAYDDSLKDTPTTTVNGVTLTVDGERNLGAWAGSSATLGGQFSLNLYFTKTSVTIPEGGKFGMLMWDAEDVEAALLNGGKLDPATAEKMVVTETASNYRTQINEISAKDADKVYYCSFYVEDAEGNTTYSMLLACSLTQYATHSIDYSESTETLRAIARAILVYNDAAKLAFGN